IKTVVTSKAFLEKVKLKIPVETVFLEEIAGRSPSPPCRAEAARRRVEEGAGERRPLTPGAPTIAEKLTAFLMAWLLPARLLERSLGREANASLDDLATVIFSSGSTGEPKGVMRSEEHTSE